MILRNQSFSELFKKSWGIFLRNNLVLFTGTNERNREDSCKERYPYFHDYTLKGCKILLILKVAILKTFVLKCLFFPMLVMKKRKCYFYPIYLMTYCKVRSLLNIYAYKFTFEMRDNSKKSWNLIKV